MTTAEIHQGKALDVMAGMAAESVDAIVTDPPYMVGVLGNEWDTMDARGFQTWCTEWAAEALRVLKPGGYLAAFGSPRTYHRLASGVEDAGFTIRDSFAWLHTQGFPPSADMSEPMADWLANGAQAPAGPSEDVLAITRWLREQRDAAGWTNKRIDALFGTAGMAGHWTSNGSQPAVPRIEQWDRLREALGFDDTGIRAQVERLAATRTWTGGQGVKKTRLFQTLKRGAELTGEGQEWGTRLKPAFEPVVMAQAPLIGPIHANVRAYGTGALHTASDGKFPANVLIEAGLPVLGLPDPADHWPAFRYTPKAPSDERPTVNGVTHPTPKPLALIRWLVDLLTPPGGVVLDPFAGSGTTALAALAENRQPVLIEKEPTYVPIIRHRLAEPIQPALV